MNKFLCTGRLTIDPKYVSYNNTDGFANFAIAVQRPNTKNNIVDFFSCVVWKEKADFVTKYLHKGDLVAITGVLQTRSYKDRETGASKVMVEIYVEIIEPLSTKKNNDNSNNGNNNNYNNTRHEETFGTETPEYEPPF